jgi:hypothetical protein
MQAMSRLRTRVAEVDASRAVCGLTIQNNQQTYELTIAKGTQKLL